MSIFKLKIRPIMMAFLIIILVFPSMFVCASVMRQSKSLRAPLQYVFGLGPWCVGCPAHFCDDDPNIIEGYCCGCAKLLDNLPVLCPPTLKCPLNTYQLCLRYEYMMHCCC